MGPGDLQSLDDPATEANWIDLLVDGSLDESTREGLIQKWETDPTGWRRCALAFLEAQAFREGCQRFRDQPCGSPTLPLEGVAQPQVVTPAIVGKPVSSPWSHWLVAASLGLSFALGWFAPVVGPAVWGSRAKDSLQQGSVDPKDHPTRDVAVEEPLRIAQLGTHAGVSPSPGERVESQVPDGSEPSKPTPEGKAREIAQVFRQLEKTGYDPNVRSRVVTIRLPDGRRVEVPVEEIVWKYRGKQTY